MDERDSTRIRVDGKSDYERYLRTDDLLKLQKSPGEMVHRDELLFQTTHQSCELWLKLAVTEMRAATEHVEHTHPKTAVCLLRRAVDAMDVVTHQMHMLAHIAPWDYHVIRPALGNGSGFDSPGFRALRAAAGPLESAFHALLAAVRLDVVTLYREHAKHSELYELAELLVSLDEKVSLWRVRHFKLVERTIGGRAVGTQGTPVEVLARLLDKTLFPRLWEARNELTRIAADEGYAPSPRDSSPSWRTIRARQEAATSSTRSD